VIVSRATELAEQLLADGDLACPHCRGGQLTPWGYGRRRTVRSHGGATVTIRPRRTRCGSCGSTHIVLPAPTLFRSPLWCRRGGTVAPWAIWAPIVHMQAAGEYAIGIITYRGQLRMTCVGYTPVADYLHEVRDTLTAVLDA
jgi:hypothetical protein